MRRLDRYIARSVWFSVLLVLLVVVGIDALSAFIDESQDRSESYSFAEIARYVAYSLPGRCYEYIPFAALIGSLIGLGQLASSSELVVMRAAGVSNGRLARVVLMHAVLIAALGFALGEFVAPAAEQAAQSTRALALYADRQADREAGIWKRDNDAFLRVEAVEGEERIFGVSVWEFDEDGSLKRALFADRGEYALLDGVLNNGASVGAEADNVGVSGGTITTPEEASEIVVGGAASAVNDPHRRALIPALARRMGDLAGLDTGTSPGGWRLEDVAISFPNERPIVTEQRPSLFLPSNITPRVLTLENVAPGQLALDDLIGYADFLRRQGQDTADFQLALWRKLLQPLAVAALVLVAISFVFGPLRDGTLGFRIFAGVMVGVLFRLSQDLLGPASLVFGFAPLYAAAIPIGLCTLTGLWLLRRA